MYTNLNLKRCDKFVPPCSFKATRGYNFDAFVKKNRFVQLVEVRCMRNSQRNSYETMGFLS